MFISSLRYMLHAAIVCSIKVIHRPFGPCIEPRNIGSVASLLVNASQCEENRHSVDILGGTASSKSIPEPVFNDPEAFGILRQLVVLPDSVEANAMGPLPVVPAFGVDDSAIVELEEEFAGFVCDVDEVIDQEFDYFVHVCGRNIMLDGWHCFFEKIL